MSICSQTLLGQTRFLHNPLFPIKEKYDTQKKKSVTVIVKSCPLFSVIEEEKKKEQSTPLISPH